MAPVALAQYNTSQGGKQMALSEYIFQRISTLGVNRIFGVPGDYNLSMLEHIYSVPQMKWIGCCNELNSAYAADGYARMRGLGVILTTQGVGELSAINGISGSFAEHVPVLHIVGTTKRASKTSGTHMHHLINGVSTMDKTDHYVYEKMARFVSCKTVSIDSVDDAPHQIDELIETILTCKKPGYLYVPCDIVNCMVDASGLSQIPSAKLPPSTADVDAIVSKIQKKLQQASKPVLLADILTDRFHLTSLLQSFVEKFQIPTCNTLMGKALMYEQSKCYLGDYIGDESHKLVKAHVQSTDCLIHVGDYYNEINSGHFTLYDNIKKENIIKLNPEYVDIGGETYKVSFESIVPRLLTLSNLPKFEIPTIEAAIEHIDANTPISQTYLLEKLQDFLKPNDVVITDTCSLMFGLPDLRFPLNSKVIGQHYYLSIGMALPCSFGVSVAMKEVSHKGRLIVIQGDGAAQMTMQEWSNFGIEESQKPLILLLNNNGYTVERIIKGAERGYNDIRPDWKWTEIFNVFSVPALTAKVTEREDLDVQLEKMGKENELPRLLEITLDQLDVPWRFHKMVGN